MSAHRLRSTSPPTVVSPHSAAGLVGKTTPPFGSKTVRQTSDWSDKQKLVWEASITALPEKTTSRLPHFDPSPLAGSVDLVRGAEPERPATRPESGLCDLGRAVGINASRPRHNGRAHR